MVAREEYYPLWDEQTASIVKSVVEDFVFLDHRLAMHPKVSVDLTVDFKDRVRQNLFRRDAGLVWEHATLPITHLLREDLVDIFELPLCIRVEQPFGSIVLWISDRTLKFKENRDSGDLLAALISYVYIRSDNMAKHLWYPSLENLGRALQSVRKSLGLSQAALAQQIKQSRIALSQWERGRQPPSLGPLFEWCRTLGILSSTNRPIVTIVDITPNLLNILRENPQKLRSLSPSQFEKFIAGRLGAMGFDVALTGQTNQPDGGIYLIAVPKIRTLASFLLAGQVKHHRGNRKTGIEAVDRLLSWRNRGFNLGLLVTNTEFTSHARWLAMQEGNQSFLRLRDFEDLKRWLQDNFTSEKDWREIPDRIILTPDLTIEIPKPRIISAADM